MLKLNLLSPPAISNFYDVVARTDFSFLQHAKVESRSVVSYEQGRHARFIRADADAVTGHARLCHFEHRATNAESITDTDLVISKSFNSEVFSELADTKISAAEKAIPIAVRIHLVNEHSALLSAVTGEICLRVTFNIQRAHQPSPFYGKLPDRGSHSLAVPCDLTRRPTFTETSRAIYLRPPRE